MMKNKLNALLDTLEDVKNPKERVSVIHSAFGETPHLVAFVDLENSLTVAEKLEFAFMKTNTINDAWWNNDEVTPMFPDKGCRSTSVGDAVLIGKDKYTCESTGWSDPSYEDTGWSDPS